MRSRRAQFAKRALCTTIFSGFLTSQILPVAVAGPSGGVVVGGQGLITQSGLLTQIDQSSHRLIIEWDSFDTSTQETVRFFQPNRDAMALNRVLSGQATQFNGSLFANGNVVIVNGAGIHFGPNSQVDVGGLIASTADISNSNFLSGDLIFDQPGNPDAMVTNAGTITARDAGLAALVAPGVENSGLIRAELGTVVLGAGETHTIDFRGDGLISFALTSPTTTVPRRADGSEADALVTNSGTVEADGGSVVMTASQASRVLDTAINMSGVAQANSVGVRNGRIVLGGGGAGRVRLPGQVRARGTSAGTTGGTVHVTGQEISTQSAQIDASGVDGGGTVLVGGAERGQTLEPTGDVGYLNEDDTLTIFLGDSAAAAGDGFMPLASRTTVDAASFFDASSSAGDGGDVVVWGADEVNFHGTISTLGGDNGFVEVSTLGTGVIDGLAHTGHFLVDPGDVCITTASASGCVAGATPISASTIIGTLNIGGTFELNTDDPTITNSGTGRVDFGGGGNFTINNNSGTQGTFIIHAADTINTQEVGILSDGDTGTNFEWHAGSNSTTSPVLTADIDLGGQPFNSGGGDVLLTAANDILVTDPLITNGGNVTLDARGGDRTALVRFGGGIDGRIDTTDSAGGAGSVTIFADELTMPTTSVPPVINANGTGGLVTLQPQTAGTTINLGTTTVGSLSLTDAEIDRIAAETLRFGDATSGDITISAAISPLQATNLSLVTGGEIFVNAAVTTDNGAINFTADDMTIAAAIDAGTAIATLAELTADTTIDLGTNSVGNLGLTDTELDQITAGTLRIGSSDAGSITFTDMISPAGTDTLSLITGDRIIDGHSGQIDVQVDNLALQAVNGITDRNPVILDTDVETLAALNTTSGGISIVEVGFGSSVTGGDLTIGTVDGVVGVRNLATVGAARSSQIETNNGDLTIDDDIFINRGTLLLVAQHSGNGDRTFTNNAAISTTNRDVTIRANNMVLDASSSITAGSGERVTLENDLSGVVIDLGGVDGVGQLGLTDDEINTVTTTGVLQIGNFGSGDVTFSGPIAPTGVSTMDLRTGGSILDDNAGTDVTIENLVLRAGIGIGEAADGIDLQVDNLALPFTVGPVWIANNGDLTITNVDDNPLSQVIGVADLTASGTLTIATPFASTGDMTLTADVLTVAETGRIRTFAPASLFVDAETANLHEDIEADGGLSGTATTVNVFSGAEIQDGVDVAAAAGGAIVNVGDGLFDGGIFIDKPLTLLGDGFTNTTTVNVADSSAGMTVVSSGVTIDDFLFSGDAVPVNATGVLIDGSGGTLSNVLVGDANAGSAGNRFTSLTTGLLVTDGGGTNTVEFEIGFGNVFDDSLDGIVLDGAGVGLTGNTFSDASFAADISGDYIRLEDGAAFLPGSPTVLDATGATFDGVLGSDLTAAEAIAVEEALVHYLDDQTLGLIQTGPLAVTSGNSIQIAVNAAGLLGGAQTVAVGSGTFGGSVEVWVDDLTLVGQGATTIIDTDAVDPFANNGDVNNGFQVAAIDATGTNPTDPSGAGDVTGVTIEGFAFTDGAPTGENIGIELGAPGFGVSAAEDTTILNSSFTNLLDGIVAHNATGLTAISGVTMSGIAQHGVRFEGFPDGDDAFLVQQSSIESAGNAIRFAGFGTGYTASIDGNTLVSTGDSAVQFARGFNNANISIVDNDLIQGAQDGILFDDEQTSATAFNGGSITIAGNFSILGEARDGIRISENLFNNDFTVGTANVTFLGSTTAHPGNGSIVGGERGIHVIRGLSGNDGVFRVANNGSIQGLGDDAIRFGASVLNGASVGIVGNSEVRGATDGIDLFSVTLSLASSNNRSSLLIAGNGGIYGEGATSDGVTVDVSVFQSDVTIGAGSFLVGDTDMAFGGNGEIIGGDAGIDIDRVVQTSTVSVLDNTLVQGGTDGLVFSDFIDNGVVAVSGNTAIEGDGDGIEFASTIGGGSSITVSQNQRIEGLGTAPDEDDLGDGIVFRDAISGAPTTVLIDDNDLIQGNDRGIAFTDSATVNDSSITISRNDEIRGTNIDGILFNNDLTDATIVIGGPAATDGNDLIIGGEDGVHAEDIFGGSFSITRNAFIRGLNDDAIEFNGEVRQSAIGVTDNVTILGDDDGVAFDGIVRNSVVDIIENAAILGFDNGVEFEEVVRNSFVTIGGNLAVAGGSHGVVFEELVRDSGVTVDGNFAIVSFGDGIGFEGEIRDTNVDINNNFLIAGLFGDGIEFGDVIRLGSEVTIAENNFIGGGEDGIEFEGAIRSNSEVAIQDNIDIVGFDTGIDFNRVIRNSEVSIDGNVSITGITGDGVAMRRLRSATVGITDNTSIFGGEDGITVERGLARSDFSVTGNTDITGVDDGLNIGFIRRGSFLVSENGTIEGINGSGMEFERRITDVQDFVVEDNELIVGGEEAIEFDTRAAILRSTLRFTNNAMEAGTDGMLFDGLIGRSTIITEENIITAGENGINLTNYGGGSSFSVEASEVSGMLGGLTVTGSRRGGPQSLLTLGDTSFNGVATAGISVTTRAGGNGITTAFEDGVVTTGFPSLAMSGPNQAIAGNTIANVAFNSVAGGNFITLSNGALFEPGRPTIILGTGASFDGTVVGSNAEQATINWVEGRIIDFDDNPTLGQIFFFYLPYLFDSGFGDGPVRTTNIQTPGDWILRPDFFFQILATNPLRDDYGLGTCVFEYSETEGRFLPRCINHAGPVDPSPAIQRTLEGMEELSALQ